MTTLLQTTDTNIAKNATITAAIVARFEAYSDVREKSKTTYRTAIKQFLKWLQAQDITQPVREDVIQWREELKETHKATTVQLYLTAVKLLFQWLEQEQLYPDIAKHIKSVRIEKGHKKDYLTSSQSHRVLACIDKCDNLLLHARNYAMIALMMTTGLRTIEVSRANIEDMRTVGDSTVLFIQGKGRDEKNEYVKIVPQVEAAIREYLMKREAAAAAEPLFTTVSNNGKGKRVSTRTIRDAAKAAMKAAGYDSDRLTAHSLRHTAGTLALLNGSTIREVQQLLRHSNINTTMIYMHDLDRASNNSESNIAGAIF